MVFSTRQQMIRNEDVTLVGKLELDTFSSCLRELLPALERLDALLSHATSLAQQTYGPEAGADRFRGLHISEGEVDRLLTRPAAAPLFSRSGANSDEPIWGAAGESSRLARLQRTYELSSFDLDVLLIALAPELDLRYERLYAYLQDDVTKKRPTVELALNLLCRTAAERIAQRYRFGSGAPLRHHRIVWVGADPNQLHSPLLAHYLKLDDQITRFLLGQASLDSRLAGCCELIRSTVCLADLPLEREVKSGLVGLSGLFRETRKSMLLWFHGPENESKVQTAKALAAEIGTSILVVDLARAVRTNRDLNETVALALREAWLGDSVLLIEAAGVAGDEDRKTLSALFDEGLAEKHVFTILASERPCVPVGRTSACVINIPFLVPQVSERRECWTANTGEIPLRAEELTTLARRFRLTPGQIGGAVSAARSHALWRNAASPGGKYLGSDPPVTIDDLSLGARAQCGHELASLARKVNPIYTWEDIILPQETTLQLREMCDRVTHRERVFSEWGFDRKLSLGKGVNALFAGPSGTGKTMAAEIIANELGLDLYKIDLSGVVSKYIGETEKNLDCIFKAAESANAILFFDEADALFGKRSEVHDSHDRYANIEISYLLQKMEEYEGVSILASNRRQDLDEAFIRRLAFTVSFPFPGEEDRLRIWTGMWPAGMPKVPDLDFSYIARRFKFSGGNIKNVALAASFLAASDGGIVTMQHLFHATQREFDKMGKRLTKAELYGEYPTDRLPVNEIEKSLI